MHTMCRHCPYFLLSLSQLALFSLNISKAYKYNRNWASRSNVPLLSSFGIMEVSAQALHVYKLEAGKCDLTLHMCAWLKWTAVKYRGASLFRPQPSYVLSGAMTCHPDTQEFSLRDGVGYFCSNLFKFLIKVFTLQVSSSPVSAVYWTPAGPGHTTSRLSLSPLGYSSCA